MNIEKCLDNYSEAFYHDFYGMNRLINDEKALSQQASLFLHRYAMSDSEYNSICVPVMQKVFKSSPSKTFNIREEPIGEMFRDKYKYFTYQSSPLFWDESYELIQKICSEYGDQYLFIIEEESCEKDPDMAFKIKIPVNHSWEEVSNGGYITDVLFNMFRNNYYVFGDRGMWGRWCDYNNDYMDYEAFGYMTEVPAVSKYKDYFSDFLEEIAFSKKTCLGVLDRIKRYGKNLHINLLSLLMVLSFFPSMISATEMGDSIDTYYNHTVTTTVQLQGRDTIGVRNVTVTSTGHLKMNAPGGIIVSSELYVQTGGTLELHGGHQWPVTYNYDGSGNTIRRRRD